MNFTPTLRIKETSKHIKRFVSDNNDELWRIFKPFIPFIVGLHLFDAVLAECFRSFASVMVLGQILASYFYTCLIISWHRVVINGVDNYTPVNPFKPKKHELAFLGMGILIGVLLMGFVVAVAGMSIVFKSSILGLLSAFLVVVGIYFSYRISFYFPAKAINAQFTLREVFGLSKGYFWKLLSVSFLAALKWIGLAIVYSIVVNMVFFAYVYFVGIGVGAFFVLLLLKLPMLLYFNVFITVIGVTTLSNYYLYAIQNPKGRDVL